VASSLNGTVVIERVPLERLRPAEWNPRLLKEKRFKELCKSLVADPGLLERRPILAMLDGTIYAGNQRFRAAQHLGWTTIPAVLDDVSADDAKARAIRDNNSAGEWQEDQYAALLYELGQSGVDLATLGADQKDIDALLASVGVGGAEEDAVPEPPADPITRPGDLWLLGPHRLLCGDSTRREDVERLMAGERADIAFTDPPYGIGYLPDSDLKRLGKLENDHRDGRWEGFDEFSAFIDVSLDSLLGALRPGACYYVCMGWEHLADVLSAVASRNARAYTVIVWDRMTPRITSYPQDYIPVNEFIAYGWKRGANRDRVSAGIEQTTIWRFKTEKSEDMQHTTQKPVALVANALGNSSGTNALVLDLFLGSGTTLVAAEQLNRRCYGMEMDPRYCDVAVTRFENLTGQTATREPAEATCNA
jgi:DNA modification methylase